MKQSQPTCPHCQYEFDDDETWHSHCLDSGEVYDGDGDISELKCPNLDCGKSFHVQCVHDISWTACEEYGDELVYF